MLNTEEISKNIVRKQDQLAALEKELEIITQDIKSKQKAFSESILLYGDREKRPASLGTQKRYLAEASSELEAVRGAADQLREEIADLENQKTLTSLHDQHVQAYHAAMERYKESMEKVKGLYGSLSREIIELTSAVSLTLSESEIAIGCVKAIERNLAPGLSMAEFLNGGLMKLPNSDHETVLKEIGRDIQRTATETPEDLDIKGLERLIERLTMLATWRRNVLNFNPRNLIENRKSLISKVLPRKQSSDVGTFQGPDYMHVLRHKNEYSKSDVDKAEAALAGDLGDYTEKDRLMSAEFYRG